MQAFVKDSLFGSKLRAKPPPSAPCAEKTHTKVVNEFVAPRSLSNAGMEQLSEL
jgi:hypothetical protein